SENTGRADEILDLDLCRRKLASLEVRINGKVDVAIPLVRWPLKMATLYSVQALHRCPTVPLLEQMPNPVIEPLLAEQNRNAIAAKEVLQLRPPLPMLAGLSRSRGNRDGFVTGH